MRAQSVIIIGAPRSGTNMLRDVLTSLEGVGTWPCDEINYIWRHGNALYPTDEIPLERASEKVSQYIRNQFNSMAKKLELEFLVEKTCANSLRVPFVDRVIPGAKYIYIYRNGVDVAASAKERWHANLNLGYILKKARFIPVSDFPVYALRYFFNRIYRLVSTEKRLALWGPVFSDMKSALSECTLFEACALQWSACVEKAEKDLMGFDTDKLIKVSYESFVTNPKAELTRLTRFLGINASEAEKEKAVANVSDKSIGKAFKIMNIEEINRVKGLVYSSLKRYEYI